MQGCPFCELSASRIIIESELSMAFADGFPVTPGHTLIVPKRHVRSFFDLSQAEQTDLLDVASQCKTILDREHGPGGFNLGINDGAVAGQTIAHVHLHLIPRYEGDVDDPRGGIRWVIPEKAVYWDEETP